VSTIFIDAANPDWAVFPCHSIVDGRCTCGGKDSCSPGKHPRTANGLKDATRDKSKLAQFSARWPQSNVAVVTGETNGIVVIDVDPAHGGSESLAAMEVNYGKLPATVTVETGGGGLHHYYRYPAAAKIGSCNAWLKGVDVKADGGYVIAPPSVHASGGKYRWAAGHSPDEIELAEIPAWLLAELPRKDVAPQLSPRVDGSATGRQSLLQRAQSYVAKAPSVGEGERNDAAFRLAGNVAAIDDSGSRLSESEIVAVLTPWNLGNSPPLEPSELRDCVASALKNGTPRPAKESRNGSAMGASTAAVPAGSLREKLAAIIGDPNLTAWFDLKAIKWLSDPARYSLCSAQFAKAEHSRLEFPTIRKFGSKQFAQDQARDKAFRGIPAPILKKWSPIVDLLCEYADVREADLDERRDVLIASILLDVLEKAKLAPNDEPFSDGSPAKLSDGSVLAQMHGIYEAIEIQHPRFKVEPAELVRCALDVAAAKKKTKRFGNRVMTFKDFRPAGLHALAVKAGRVES
jgi:hypothetical protein